MKPLPLFITLDTIQSVAAILIGAGLLFWLISAIVGRVNTYLSNRQGNGDNKG
jgi:hypothetical protein